MVSLIAVVCLFSLVLSVSTSPTVDHMEWNCGSTITVFSSVRIKLDHTWPSNNPCVVSFVGSTAYHSSSNTLLSARVRHVDIDTDMFDQCTQNRLDILDYDGSFLSSRSGICGTSPPLFSPYDSTRNGLKVNFTRLNGQYRSSSFDILITRFSNSICTSSEFMCDGDLRCVSYSVTCDGFQDCPDDSDELLDSCFLSTGYITGMCIVGLVGFSFFVVLVIALHRRRRYGRVFGVPAAPYAQSIQTSATYPTYGTQQPYQAGQQYQPPPPYPGSPQSPEKCQK